MRILVACESSGKVRDAFRVRGHDAWSCDLLECEGDPQWHIVGDARPILREPWDLVIAHPPCTYLSFVGNRHWHAPGRAEKREAAMAFFLECYHANAPRVCVENPMGHPTQVFRKPDQTIDPYFFGDRFRKRTCLWLRGLPPLIHRQVDELFGPQTHVPPPEPMYYLATTGKPIHWTEGVSGWRTRSRTFPGIANAMADQWGSLTP